MTSCKTCVYADHNQKFCRALQTSIGMGEFHCPYHSYELYACGICGRTILSSPRITYTDETVRIYCNDCLNKNGTCEMCVYGHECDFETNPSPIPKTIIENFQQGPMTIQRQVINPERTVISCQNNCPCFSQEFGCLKQNDTCGNFKGVIL